MGERPRARRRASGDPMRDLDILRALDDVENRRLEKDRAQRPYRRPRRADIRHIIPQHTKLLF
tara:strand:- start:1877 stop:2065 length:189 start_codon:yes stop_codon:yes gene_type:complete